MIHSRLFMGEWQYHYYRGHQHSSHFVTQWLSRLWVTVNAKQPIRSLCSWKTTSTIELCCTPETVPSPRWCYSGSTIPPAGAAYVFSSWCFVFAPVCTGGPKGGTAGRLRLLNTSKPLWRREEWALECPLFVVLHINLWLEWQLSVQGSLEKSSYL